MKEKKIAAAILAIDSYLYRKLTRNSKTISAAIRSCAYLDPSSV